MIRPTAPDTPASRDDTSLAKLIPPAATAVVARDRLFAALDAARGGRVAFVHGPPGAGKTTLVASWLRARAAKALWYRIDEGDADPASFFHYLAVAARHAGVSREALPAFSADRRHAAVAFARGFFRALFGALPQPFVLVLDEFQEAESELHAMVRCGAEELPPLGSAVLVSRGDPPPALAALRARGAVELVPFEALRVTREEAGAIAEVRRPGMSDAALAALHRRSQGWAAGIVLLLAGGGVDEAASLPPGTPQVVFDYFATEIFEAADPDVRRVLLETALLPDVTEPAATRLTGLPTAGSVLRDLARRGYFTVCRSGEPPTYEYHPLFREFLLARAEEALGLEGCAARRREAGRILEAERRVEAAVDLYRRAGAWEEMAAAVLHEAPGLMRAGRVETLGRWIAALPRSRVDGDPWMTYWTAVGEAASTMGGGRPGLERAFDEFSRRGDAEGAYRAWAGIVEGYRDAWEEFGSLDRWIDEMEGLRRRWPRFPTGRLEARVASAMLMALTFRRPGGPAVHAWAARVAELAAAGGSSLLTRMLVDLAVYHCWCGEPREAGRLLATLLVQVERVRPGPMDRLRLCAVEGWIEMAAGLPERAAAALRRGLEMEEAGEIHPGQNFILQAELAWAALASGNVDEASEVLARAPVHLGASLPVTAALVEAALGLIALRRGGARAAVERAGAACALARASGLPMVEALVESARGVVHLEAGDEGHAPMQRGLALARGMGHRSLEYSALVADAAHAIVAGRGEARELARAALECGREHDILTPRLTAPDALADLCAYALDAGIEVEYVGRLVRARRLTPPPRAAGLESWPWRLAVRALGRFALYREGVAVAFPGRVPRRQLQLLKLLIVRGPGPVPVDAITATLWDEADGDRAGHAFEATLSRLRRLLGEEILALRDGAVALDTRHCWVDAWALDHLLDRADAALTVRAPLDPEGLLACSDRAVALYRGRLLAADGDTPWAVRARERIRAKLRRHLAAVRERGGPAGAQHARQALERLAGVDPDFGSGKAEA